MNVLEKGVEDDVMRNTDHEFTTHRFHKSMVTYQDIYVHTSKLKVETIV